MVNALIGHWTRSFVGNVGIHGLAEATGRVGCDSDPFVRLDEILGERGVTPTHGVRMDQTAMMSPSPAS